MFQTGYSENINTLNFILNLIKESYLKVWFILTRDIRTMALFTDNSDAVLTVDAAAVGDDL